MNRKSILAFVALSLFGTPAFGSIYWYNGNPDFVDNLLDEVGDSTGNSFAFDNFLVGAGGVTITGLFSNDSIRTYAGGITQAYWEIRSGLSEGNGGTLVASGTNAITITDTGSVFAGEIYDFEVDGLDVNLSAGTYWLALAPVVTDADPTFIDQTAGAGGVGTPQDQDGYTYFNSPAYGPGPIISVCCQGTLKMAAKWTSRRAC